MWPIDRFWNPVMERLAVPAIHYQEFPELGNFEFPDGSHLDLRNKPEFTRRLFTCSEITKQLEASNEE